MVFGYDNRITAGALLFIGGAQFTIFLIVAEAVYSSYSVSANYISDLSVWIEPSAAIFNPVTIIFGLLVLASDFFIQREFKMSVVSIAVALSGLGAKGVGFFPEHTFVVNGVPILHALSAGVGFIIRRNSRDNLFQNYEGTFQVLLCYTRRSVTSCSDTSSNNRILRLLWTRSWRI